MSSVRLPQRLENQLTAFSKAQHLAKSAVVQLALDKHLSLASQPVRKTTSANLFAAPRGTGKRKLTTGEIMGMTQGNDWMHYRKRRGAKQAKKTMANFVALIGPASERRLRGHASARAVGTLGGCNSRAKTNRH